MKKIVQREVHACDVCGAEHDWPQVCMKCGKELCYNCRDKEGVTYECAVFHSGSGDGFYCKPCDKELTKSRSDKKHNAYRCIQSLRDEQEGWSTDFRKRTKVAEELVQSLREDK